MAWKRSRAYSRTASTCSPTNCPPSVPYFLRKSRRFKYMRSMTMHRWRLWVNMSLTVMHLLRSCGAGDEAAHGNDE